MVANLLFQSIDGLSEELLLQFRTKLILNLARLCQRQETRHLKAPDRRKGQLTAVEEYELGDSTAGLGKRRAHEITDEKPSKRTRPLQTADQDGQNMQRPQGQNTMLGQIEGERTQTGLGADLYPMTFTNNICLICVGDETRSYPARMKTYRRKDTLQKHINTHLRKRAADEKFPCPHPLCSLQLDGVIHFKNHAVTVHEVSY